MDPNNNATWPLHLKRVSHIQYMLLLELPSHDPAVRANAAVQFRYLYDVTMYSAVPRRAARDCPKANLTDDQVRECVEFGVFRKVPRREVQGGARIFLHDEPAKLRRRVIKHTADANEAMTDVAPMKFPSKVEIALAVHAGTHCAAVDLAAMYDQFELDPAVGSLFGFRNHSNEYFVLNTLAMGQRQAVQVAMAATCQLLNYKTRCKVLIVIDNVLFVGSYDDVLADLRELRVRSDVVHAQFNEDLTKPEELIVTETDWCGLHICCETKTVKLTAKTVNRINESWARRAHWTWRGFAAHVGLLFWSYGIIDAPVSEYFNLLSFISRSSRALTADPAIWDVLATIPSSAMEPMDQWTRLALCNVPRLVRSPRPAQWLVVTDASRWGWGYCAVNTSTGVVLTHGAPWSGYMEQYYGDQLGHSSVAEPHGVTNSLLHLNNREVARSGCPVVSVRLGTDNTATRYAFPRQFSSHSMAINAAISRLHRALPLLQLDCNHVAGKLNAADRMSRGGAYTQAELVEVAWSLWQVLGSDSGWKQVHQQ